MKYKPTKKQILLALAFGLFALGFTATRSGSRSGHNAAYYGSGYGPAYGGGAGGYGNFGPQFGGSYPDQGGAYGGGSADGWYGGDFHSNPNLGTAVSSSGGSGYLAVGGGDFVSW